MRSGVLGICILNRVITAMPEARGARAAYRHCLRAALLSRESISLAYRLSARLCGRDWRLVFTHNGSEARSRTH